MCHWNTQPRGSPGAVAIILPTPSAKIRSISRPSELATSCLTNSMPACACPGLLIRPPIARTPAPTMPARNMARLDGTAVVAPGVICSNAPISVHIERRIFPKYVGGGDQGMLRHRARRQCLAAKQTQAQRQHVVAVAVHVIGDGAEHHAAAVVRVDFLLFAGAAVDVRVEPLAYDNAVALPPVHFDGARGVNGGQIVQGRDQQPPAGPRQQEL